MADFAIRDWTLEPYDGEQAPLHIHHGGDEAFFVVSGLLDVRDGGQRHRLEAGGLHVVSAGSPHTFATVGDEPVRVLVVMTPEIDALVQALHTGESDDPAAVWARYHSEVVG